MAMTSDREKTRVAGCDGYISKPLRYRDLYACIDALLGIFTPASSPEALK
jgi:two-component system cell cycle response regulator DivK